MNSKILIFAMASDQKEAIRVIGDRLGIAVTVIPLRDYEQQIGFLAGIVGFKKKIGKYKGPDIADPMMLLSGMNSELVDQFLAEYRKAGLPKINLKAVITPTNAFWTPLELCQELSREHKDMHKNMQ